MLTNTEDGFYKEEPRKEGSLGPKNKPKVLVKISQKVIQNCVGLAIFTVMRTGLWVSGASGSGVLTARKEDGNWSPPSGILVHTLGVGFMAGIDIYDCVIVINNHEALSAFSKLRVSLGGEISMVAGPVGIGGILESELLKSQKPVWSYVKSRGLYGGLQVDGTIIIERNDENAKFYGQKVSVGEILAGHVHRSPSETRMLMEVLKQAEGRTDYDEATLHQASQRPPPGDVRVEKMSDPTQEQMNAYAPPPNYGPDYHPGSYYQQPGQGKYQQSDNCPPPPPGPPPTHGSSVAYVHSPGPPTYGSSYGTSAAYGPPSTSERKDSQGPTRYA
jgi:lipid-binding SYLF domain-containing protein